MIRQVIGACVVVVSGCAASEGGAPPEPEATHVAPLSDVGGPPTVIPLARRCSPLQPSVIGPIGGALNLDPNSPYYYYYGAFVGGHAAAGTYESTNGEGRYEIEGDVVGPIPAQSILFATFSTKLVWGSPADPFGIPQELCVGVRVVGSLEGLANGAWTTIRDATWVGVWGVQQAGDAHSMCLLQPAGDGTPYGSFEGVLTVPSLQAQLYSAFRVSARAYLIDFRAPFFGTKHPMDVDLSVGELFSFVGGQ